MDQIIIQGGAPLLGTVRISGAKNSALPLLAASLLSDQELVLHNVPQLADIDSMFELLTQHGVQISKEGNTVTLNAKGVVNTTAPYELVRKMRSSIVVLGPLLSRFGKARVSLPGGCAIGTRPVDIHIEGLRKLGAEIELEEGYIVAKAPHGLTGNTYTMPLISVQGTENIMMAAVLAKGETKLINAAREPEVVDLANCLIAMGAKIEGAGTDTITIQGVDSLQPAQHTVVCDRIEMGTYAIAALITKGELTLTDCDISLIPTVSDLLIKAGGQINLLDEQNPLKGFHIKTVADHISGVDVLTEPYPGFATDIQAQMMALMTIAQGASMITETIFENRFMHVSELCRMGANINIHGSSALVRGVPQLKGAPVMATDLRASASLVLAGLAAVGQTTVQRIYHLDRGYDNIVGKLQNCGATIERTKAD